MPHLEAQISSSVLCSAQARAGAASVRCRCNECVGANNRSIVPLLTLRLLRGGVIAVLEDAAASGELYMSASSSSVLSASLNAAALERAASAVGGRRTRKRPSVVCASFCCRLIISAPWSCAARLACSGITASSVRCAGGCRVVLGAAVSVFVQVMRGLMRTHQLGAYTPL